MKTLLILLLCFVSHGLFAENWIAENDIPLANAQTPDVPGYTKEADCLAANPGQVCYEFTGQNLRYRKIVGGVWVDDATLKAAYDAEVASIGAQYSPVHALARIRGNGAGDDCTSSPCVVDKVHPKPEPIVSATREGLGSYKVYFATGAFATGTFPVCTATNDRGSSEYCALSGSATHEYADVLCFTAAGVAADTRFTIVCGGKR